MPEAELLPPGTRVRLIEAPDRVGVILEGHEGSGPTLRQLVVFLDQTEDWILRDALEAVRTERQLSPSAAFRDKRFGHWDQLRGALTFHRLSGRLSNLVYSLNTTNTDFFAYQFKPIFSHLETVSRGILIADEVGLGKTIEAGLLWMEIRARYDARRLLVLCPAMLREKWRSELLARFDVKAEVCESAEDVATAIKDYRDGLRSEFVLVASIQGLRPPKGWEDADPGTARGSAKLATVLDKLADEEVPLFDAVIIDEAHYLRNPESQSNKLGRLLRSVTDNLFLLSATPIQTSNDDLYSLVNLIDGSAFPSPELFKSTLIRNAPVVQLRDEVLAGRVTRTAFVKALREAEAADFFGESEQRRFLIENPPTDEQLAERSSRTQIAEDLFKLTPLSHIMTRTRKRDVMELQIIRNAIPVKGEMTPLERRFYETVTHHVREMCAIYYGPATGLILTIPQRQMCSSMAAACRAWKRQLASAGGSMRELLREVIDEDLGGAVDEQEEGRVYNLPSDIGPVLSMVSSALAEAGDYEALRRDDSKYRALLSALRQYTETYKNKKIVVFSFYRATVDYLAERLIEDGYSAITLMGGMDKQTVLEKFKETGGPQILISTEVASEGVDLQFSSLLVNYDLPWNPMKIEQRIGRIDRIGQVEKNIQILNLMYKDTLDDRVYERLLLRIGIFTQALGVTEAIVGEQIHEMTEILLTHDLTPEEEAERIDRTQTALAYVANQQEKLEQESANLIAHGEYVQHKLDQIRNLNRFISKDDLVALCITFLGRAYKGCSLVRVDTSSHLYDIELTAEARADFAAFLEREGLRGKSRMASNDVGPGRTLFLFENRVGGSASRHEVISQYHPFVRFAIKEMRKNSADIFYKYVASAVDAAHAVGLPAGIYTYHVERWSVQGARTADLLMFSVADMRGNLISDEDAERLVTTTAVQGRSWGEVASQADGESLASAFDECRAELSGRAKVFLSAQRRENNDRVNQQLELSRRHFDQQILRLREVINNAIARGNRRLIPANEGKIRKLRQKAEDRRLSIERSRELTFEAFTVSSGVIRVE